MKYALSMKTLKMMTYYRRVGLEGWSGGGAPSSPISAEETHFTSSSLQTPARRAFGIVAAMVGMIFGLWILALRLAVPAPPTADEQALVARFVGALRQGAPAAFAPLFVDKSPADGPSWASVRDATDVEAKRR